MIDTAPTLADFIAAFPLFRDAILCGAIAGGVLGFFAVVVVLRRMVFVTAALTQSAGLGVALAYYVGIVVGLEIRPVVGAVCVSVAAAGLLSIHPRRLQLSRETMLALVWLGCAGASVLVGARITQEAHDIAGILFGTAVLVRPMDLALVAGVGGVALGLGFATRKGLVLVGFDPDGARVQRVPLRLLEVGFLVVLTVMVAVSTRALGALPVFAFAVLPGVAALLVSPRLGFAFPLAVAGGALSGALGYLLAFFASYPVGASQTAVAIALVLLAVPVRLLRGTA